MESSGASDLGVVVGGLVSGDLDNPITISLGLEEMIPEGLNIPLTSDIFMAKHTLPALSFLSGLTFGPLATTLVGPKAGLEPLPGLSEGLLECIGSELGDLFNVGYWASPQKYLVEDDSRAHFSPSEIIND